MNLATKANRYVRELIFCFQAGANLKTRAGLAGDTLRFHIANGLGINRRERDAEPKIWRIKLKNSVADLWLRTYGGDLFVFHEILLDQTYRIPKTWREEVATVVDLGANIGLTTLYFSQFFPDAHYVCVEPNSDNAKLLKRNVGWLGERVRVIEGAISNHSGMQYFDGSGHSWAGRLCAQETTGQQVRCYTMNELMVLCALPKIDVLKVDIEGAEEQLFVCGGEWLKSVKLMIVELHGAYTIERFRRDVTSMGFEVIPPSMEHRNQMILALNRDALRLAG